MSESQLPINPSQMFLMHIENNHKPALIVGDVVEYDHLHKSTCKSLDLFKSYLDKYYTYVFLFGTEYPQASFATYRITGIKAEEDWAV